MTAELGVNSVDGLMETVFTTDMTQTACQRPGCECTNTARVVVNERGGYKLFCPKHRPDGAHLIQRSYSNGENFFTVECQTCLSVLNSGHHYLDRHRQDAVYLAAHHNGTIHRVSL